MRYYVNKFINYVLDKIIYPVFYFCETEPKSHKTHSQNYF